MVLFACEVTDHAGRSSVKIPCFKINVSAPTRAEALIAARSQLDIALVSILSNGAEIPANDAGVSDAHVAPSARVQAGVLYRRNIGEHTDASVARALQTSWPRSKELGLGTVNISIDRAEAAAAALGYRLILQYEPLH